MRQYHLRSILALIAIIALSIRVGMQVERAKPAPRKTYTVMRPIYQTTGQRSLARPVVARSYTVMRPVRQTRGR